VTNLQQKLEGVETASTLMKEDIRIAKSNIVQLQQENLNLRRDKETLLGEHHRQMQVNHRRTVSHVPPQRPVHSHRGHSMTSRRSLNELCIVTEVTEVTQ